MEQFNFDDHLVTVNSKAGPGIRGDPDQLKWMLANKVGSRRPNVDNLGAAFPTYKDFGPDGMPRCIGSTQRCTPCITV